MSLKDFESLKSEASAWVVRLTSGEATVRDAEALKHWRELSPEHERAFREAALLWQTLEQTATPRVQQSRITRRAMLSGSIAAGGLLAAAGLSELGYLPSLNTLTADHATAVGEQKIVNLPDGSIATLDGGTAIDLDFSEKHRRLLLRTGAAMFEARAEPERPFVVAAATGTSATTGGSFAVELGPAEVSVDCLEGSISVECVNTVHLASSEAVRYSEHGVSDVTFSDAATTASWRRGFLTFRDRKVTDVVSDLNRHRKGRVVVADRAAGARRITGVFHLKRPEEILSHLESMLHLRRLDAPGGIVLLI
ncbi:FecR family protein [Ensifer adhaerens]|uniref:FecR family protein n=1 Tax=Ensifer adhaerens TaxID=106592 RepID=UPI0011778AD5|nr:FecR domain-containing protein [Ensifer adhaerens]